MRRQKTYVSLHAPFEAVSDSGERLLWKWADVQECEGIYSFRVHQQPRGDNDDNEEGIRGLYATAESSFDVGEYILAIPFTSAILVRDSLAEDDVVFKGLSTSNHIDDLDVLDGYSFWKIFCAGERNAWQPYLDALPPLNGPNFDPTPDFWHEREILQLQVPKLIGETLRRKRDIENLVVCHQRLRQDGNESRSMGITDLQWAVWVVRSRGFTTLQLRPGLSDSTRDDRTRTDEETASEEIGSYQVQSRTFLIPIIDMANHSDDPNVELEVVEVPGSYEESFFALRALSAISPGDEITMRYGTGHETSLDLLSKYGFMPRDNRVADAHIDWGLVNPQWTTTLEEDRELLAGTVRSDSMRSVLELRVAMKETFQNSHG
jgi:SET domain